MGTWTLLESVLEQIIWPIRYFFNISPRNMLIVNNVVVCICSFILTFCSLYVASLFYVESSNNSTSYSTAGSNTDWITWLGLAIVGLALTVTCIIGIRGAHVVSLELLLIYFWSIVIFIAPLLLGVIACFDFYEYMETYFQHRWELAPFSEVRKLFCPPHTADNKCRAPILGNYPEFNSVNDWCIGLYNATDCYAIRESAMVQALQWGQTIVLAQGIVAIVNMCEIVASLFLCWRILTSPVITQSMNDIINYLQLVPIGGCAGMASYLSWMQQTDIAYYWLSDYFLAMTVVQCIEIPIGIYAGREKNNVILTMYIVIVFMVAAAIIAAGVFCMLFSIALPKTFIPTASVAQEIACDRRLIGCCCCNNETLATTGYYQSRCPQWSEEEVVSMTATDMKLAGLVAFLSFAYLLGALIVAGLLRQNLKNYKSEFV